jgi:hypothetical protein
VFHISCCEQRNAHWRTPGWCMYMKARTDWERGQSWKLSLSVQEELAGYTSGCQLKSAEENNRQAWAISWQERSLDHSNQKIKGNVQRNQPERREGWKNSWQEQSADKNSQLTKSNRLTRAINWKSNKLRRSIRWKEQSSDKSNQLTKAIKK